MKIISLLFLVTLFPLVAQAKVRWAYGKPPKFYRAIFDEPKVKKVFQSVEKFTFINKEGRPQVIPLAYYELVKWLNKSLQKVNVETFDPRKVKYYIHRNPEKKDEIIGHYLRQGNRLFCFPCLLKQNNQIAYGEFVRKDVFLVQDGEVPVVLDRVQKKRIVQTRKEYKDKTKEFEFQVMKGEFPVKSVRYEDGMLYHSLNCFYQLRLHYKGRQVPFIPQVSFNNEKVPMFVSMIDDKEVLLFMDNRIQRYAFNNNLVEEKLTEYELTVPSDNFESAQFWYAPGLSAAPSFAFLEKEKLINLGEGEIVKDKRYFDKLDSALANLMELYRNDAFFYAPEEYCTMIQTCFNANNTSLKALGDTAKDWHKKDCKGVMSLDELKEYNKKTKAKNKAIMDRNKK